MLKLKVSGMTCAKCASAVTRAVGRIPSVERVSIDLDHAEVIVDGHPDERAVREAIVEEGYGIQAVA
ncbi:MAG: heavy-metal-associated domain-containing protein [Steroidobacteraceae bacterium]